MSNIKKYNQFNESNKNESLIQPFIDIIENVDNVINNSWKWLEQYGYDFEEDISYLVDLYFILKDNEDGETYFKITFTSNDSGFPVDIQYNTKSDMLAYLKNGYNLHETLIDVTIGTKNSNHSMNKTKFEIDKNDNFKKSIEEHKSKIKNFYEKQISFIEKLSTIKATNIKHLSYSSSGFSIEYEINLRLENLKALLKINKPT